MKAASYLMKFRNEIHLTPTRQCKSFWTEHREVGRFELDWTSVVHVVYIFWLLKDFHWDLHELNSLVPFIFWPLLDIYKDRNAHPRSPSDGSISIWWLLCFCTWIILWRKVCLIWIMVIVFIVDVGCFTIIYDYDTFY